MDTMNSKAFHRRIGPDHIGELVALLVIEGALIADLSAGFGIERRHI